MSARGNENAATGGAGPQEAPQETKRRSSFWADLKCGARRTGLPQALRHPPGQPDGNGVFNAGFAAYAFFSAQSFPSPTAAVYAFTVLYVPYSLIGPFAGVFIDRWSRRQIIVYGALIRAAMVAIAGFVVLGGQTGVPLYISALAVLGVNRFFLSAVSLARRTWSRPTSWSWPTRSAPPRARSSASSAAWSASASTSSPAAACWVARRRSGSPALCYIAAGLLGTRMDRDLLGPDKTTEAEGEGKAQPASAGDLGDVVAGLAGGLKHLNEKRKAAYALGVVGVQRALYGTLLVAGAAALPQLLLPRRQRQQGTRQRHAAGDHLAIGFGLAAVITPAGRQRLSKDQWIALWLLIGGIVTIVLGPTFNKYTYLAVGFALGLSAQCVKICVDTTVQETVDDAYMGRVFSLYDMLFNVAYVLGPAIAIPFLPSTGKSYAGRAGRRRALRRGRGALRDAHPSAAGRRQSPPARPTQAARR